MYCSSDKYLHNQYTVGPFENALMEGEYTGMVFVLAHQHTCTIDSHNLVASAGKLKGGDKIELPLYFLLQSCGGPALPFVHYQALAGLHGGGGSGERGQRKHLQYGLARATLLCTPSCIVPLST